MRRNCDGEVLSSRTQLITQNSGLQALSSKESAKNQCVINSVQLLMTQNRRHFIRLHTQQPNHAGIIVCTDDKNLERLATRINNAIAGEETLRGKLIRVNRPQ